MLLENPASLIVPEGADRPAGATRMGTVLIVSSGTRDADDKPVSANPTDPAPAATDSGLNDADDQLDRAILPTTPHEPVVSSGTHDAANQSVILIPLTTDPGPMVVSSSSPIPRCVEEEVPVKTDQDPSLQDSSIGCERDRDPLMVSIALENRDAVSLHLYFREQWKP